MFDQPPDNLPVQDILESVDKAPVGAAVGEGMNSSRPRPPAIRPVQPIASLGAPGSGAKRIFMFVGLSVIALAIVVGGGSLLLGIVKKKAAVNANLPAAVAPTNVPAAQPPAANVEVANVNVSASTNVNADTNVNLPVTNAPANIPPPGANLLLKDSDNDGLNDSQEQSIGTNLFAADTDNDGLSDFDEVRKWKSDPLNPDTDGDGYTDGAEVKNGYSPTGPGKIMATP